MPAPMGKHVTVEGGRRPWNVPSEAVKPGKETAKDAAIREACLECPLPDCLPNSATCAAAEIEQRTPKGSRARPVPPDFVQMAERMSTKKLATHYQTTESIVTRWKVESGLRPWMAKVRPPESFLYYGRVESLEKLRDRYGVSRSTVSKWRREMGITPDTKK